MSAIDKLKPKEKKTEKKARKISMPKFLPVFGKYFLFLLILAGQFYLAYVIVDKYYPGVYEKMNAKSPDDYGTYLMEGLVINPANTNGKRFLMVEISLDLDDKDHISLIQENNPKIQQDIIEALSIRTVQELTNVEGREELRRELSDIINRSIGVRSVRNLYFTKYVMQ